MYQGREYGQVCSLIETPLNELFENDGWLKAEGSAVIHSQVTE